MKKRLMENREGQEANSKRGKNNGEKKKKSGCSIAVVPAWGAATGNTTKKGKISKNRKKNKKPNSRMDFFHIIRTKTTKGKKKGNQTHKSRIRSSRRSRRLE